MEQHPKKPQPEEDFDIHIDQEWQELIDSVEATDIPLDMLKYLRVHLKNGESTVFPITNWIDDGEDIEQIQEVVSLWYKKNEDNIEGSDFIVDLEKLKETVQYQTDRILRDL